MEDSYNLYQDFGFNAPPNPFWIASTDQTNYPRLEKDIKVDVAIVGGGIAGITTAYLLKKEGLKVAIIEADRIVQGTSGHTTAKITSQHGMIYSKLLKHLGKEKTQQYADANQYAISFIEDIVNSNKIDCDFSKQSAYIYTQDEGFVKEIENEIEAVSSLGIDATYLNEIPLGFKIFGAECFANQAQFHPRKYLLYLANEINNDGSYIFEQSRVVDLHEGNPVTLITSDNHKVMAQHIVITTHFPFYGGNGFYFARLTPDRSYALAAKVSEDFPSGMYITAESPTRSLRFTPFNNEKLVIIGGEHHRTGEGLNTNTHYKALIDFANQNYTVIDIPYRWSTQDYSTLDDVPYVGPITKKSQNIFVATGFKKWGMTNSTASAIIIKDLIIKGNSDWAPVYNPSRFEADPMIKNFAKSNTCVAKHLIGDKLKMAPEEIDVNIGEAKIIEKNHEKVGVYKDEKGQTHIVDITCTHMGCTLQWNAAELSWDCPCHGSRFTYEGDIIEGPALKTLRTGDKFKFNP